MYKKLSIAIIITLLCLSPIAAGDWDSFAHDYTHIGYVDDSSDFVTNLWTFDFSSPIFSSPAIADNYLYLASSNGQLKSIDMEDGSQNWNVDLKSDTNSSPVIHNETLYIGSEDAFYAIDINNQYKCALIYSL